NASFRQFTVKASEKSMKLASTAADPETTQKIRITKAYTVAVLNHDAAALAALFTEDAIL
ncbi:MAG: hypothetical protein WCE49_04430, partial [Terrimicrobiaceae bacterium]